MPNLPWARSITPSCCYPVSSSVSTYVDVFYRRPPLLQYRDTAIVLPYATHTATCIHETQNFSWAASTQAYKHASTRLCTHMTETQKKKFRGLDRSTTPLRCLCRYCTPYRYCSHSSAYIWRWRLSSWTVPIALSGPTSRPQQARESGIQAQSQLECRRRWRRRGVRSGRWGRGRGRGWVWVWARVGFVELAPSREKRARQVPGGHQRRRAAKRSDAERAITCQNTCEGGCVAYGIYWHVSRP